MGVVFMAEQREPVRRKVALKIIKPGMDTRQVIGRFEAERQALAMMDHPNIAHVFDGGATESGRPYFVMELVRGMPITQYCDEAKLTTAERLQLFSLVCDAVQHAHQKGIIHRDIKPRNVLVTLHGETPVPKIIDFGVAKATHGQLTEKTVFTGFGQMIGTPAYMSPEQVAISGLDVDTRSDIYSLGVLLYELLTGVPPFDKDRFRELSYDEIRRTIREEEPPKPSTRISSVGEAATTISANRKVDPARLSHTLRGELDWIVMKSLEKDRTRRYETASDFAKDIERYINDQAVEACPPSTLYRLRKLAQRNKAMVATVASVALALIVGAGIATNQAIRATKAERRASGQEQLAIKQKQLAEERAGQLAVERREALRLRYEAEERAEREKELVEKEKAAHEEAEGNLYLARMRLAQQDFNAGQSARLLDLLDKHLPQPGGPDLRHWEWYYLLSLCRTDFLTFRGHVSVVKSVAWSPDGGRVASGGGGRLIRLWDSTTGQEIASMRSNEFILSLAWSPDGSRLASGSLQNRVRIWDANTCEEIHCLNGHAYSVACVTWDREGRYLASEGGDYELKIWDTNTGLEARTLQGSSVNPIGLDMRQITTWSPDGTRLASVEKKSTIKIWDTTKWEAGLALSTHGGKVLTLAWSPDSTKVAVGFYGGIRIWNTDTGELLDELTAHPGGVLSLSWNPKGQYLASGGVDTTVKIWNVATGQEEFTLPGHTREVNWLAWSPDGRRLASAGEDNTVKLWEVTAPDVRKSHADRAFAWSPDSRRLIVTADDGTRILDAATRDEILRLSSDDGSVLSVAWHPKEPLLATGGANGLIRLWNADKGASVRVLDGHESGVRALRFSPDGQYLASGSADSRVKIWEAGSGEELLTLRGDPGPVVELGWAPDGKRLATSASHRTPHIWDTVTGLEILSLPGPRQRTLGSMAWSPDGCRLASGGPDNVRHSSGADFAVQIWDAGSGKQVAQMRGHTALVHSLAWHPHDGRLATAGRDSVVKLWDTETWMEVLTLDGFVHETSPLAWSPDGSKLAGVDSNGSVRIWDASAGYTLAAGSSYSTDRAHRLMVDGGFEQALSIWERLAAEVPGQPDYRWNAVRCLTHLERLEEAISIQRELAQKFPERADYRKELANLYFKRADVAWHKDNFDKALPDLDEAIRFDPEFSEALDHRGFIHLKEGNPDQALADFDDAIRFGAAYTSSYRGRAETYLQKSEFSKAVADFSKAFEIEKGGNSPTAGYRLALAHLAASDIDGYRSACTRMREQFGYSKDPEEAHWLAWTCLLAPDAVDDYGLVVRLAEQAVEADPDSEVYLKTLGAILYRAGRFEEAVPRLTEANNLIEDPDTESNSSSAYTWYFLAMAHHKLGRDAEAKKWLQKATEWTDKILGEHKEGTTLLSWNRHLTLKLLREEAETLLGKDIVAEEVEPPKEPISDP